MTDGTPPPRMIAIEEFLPLVGGTLRADCDPCPVDVHLVSAAPLVNHAKLDRPPFLLIFRSSPDAILVSGSYVMRGGAFGPDRIHIQQIAALPAAAPGNYYQAVFN